MSFLYLSCSAIIDSHGEFNSSRSKRLNRCEVFKLVEYSYFLRFQNNGYNNAASFHERGNKNEIVHTIFYTIANTKLINLYNYPKWFLRISNLFLSYSTLQLVVHLMEE